MKRSLFVPQLTDIHIAFESVRGPVVGCVPGKGINVGDLVFCDTCCHAKACVGKKQTFQEALDSALFHKLITKDDYDSCSSMK